MSCDRNCLDHTKKLVINNAISSSIHVPVVAVAAAMHTDTIDIVHSVRYSIVLL